MLLVMALVNRTQMNLVKIRVSTSGDCEQRRLLGRYVV
jgi:hypothetical protein